MLFNTFEFLLFFLIVFVLFFSLPQKRRWIVLLVSSYFFYGYWKPSYLILIASSTISLLGFSLTPARAPTTVIISPCWRMTCFITKNYLTCYLSIPFCLQDLKCLIVRLNLSCGNHFLNFI